MVSNLLLNNLCIQLNKYPHLLHVSKFLKNSSVSTKFPRRSGGFQLRNPSDYWLVVSLVVLIREAYYTFFWRLCNPFRAKILVIFDLYEAVILRLNASSYSADNNQAF